MTAANGKETGPYGAPPPEMLAAEQQKKPGFLGGLFRGSDRARSAFSPASVARACPEGTRRAAFWDHADVRAREE